MTLRMACPMRRQRTQNHYLRKRIPRDVLDAVGGVKLTIPIGEDNHAYKTLTVRTKEIVVSLQTSNDREAKQRQLIALSYLEEVWESLRGKPTRLSQRNIVALAGELYRAFAEIFEENPGTPKRWQNVLAADIAANAGRYGRALLFIGSEDTRRKMALEERFGPAADALLARKGLRVDAVSRRRLLDEVAKAMAQAWFKLWQNAEGDYRPDPDADRFPDFDDHSTKEKKARKIVPPAQSLTGLLDDWWREAKATGLSFKTHQSYASTVRHFIAFLGHDDASTVRAEDVIRFKDKRLFDGIAPKTIKDSDLAGLKSVFRWAVANKRLVKNPAEGVSIKVPKRRRERSKGFSDEEANAILSHAYAHQSGHERAETSAAKRWVPWLLAYTGARVGEMAQLRREDLRKDGEIWVISITPAAGTVKGGIARDVPIHPHLVEEGFPDFVLSQTKGHLFLRLSEGDGVLGPLRGLTNRLAEFAREAVTDSRVAPNHGWRHRFKTVAMEAQIGERVIDSIVGHAPRRVGDMYGDVTIQTKAAALRRLPRYQVSKSGRT